MIEEEDDGEMDLYIETLTGTAFELRVSPFETVISVKAKIQRLEGIPVSQQHLIWQTTELEDDYCLHDYHIYDGATLKLVLAMRGGPINTRRIPMEDPALREMAEYMEANRDDILEKLPGNQQVTLLVYREGDQLNFFRVVDRGDGTLTPLSESLCGASMYNLCDDEEDEEGTGGSPNNLHVSPKEKTEEDDQMKEKMKLLRMKMDSLSLNKKPKKKHVAVPRPPSSGRPGSRSRIRHFNPNVGNGTAKSHPPLSLRTKNPLPPVGRSLIATSSGAAMSSSGETSPVTAEIAALGRDSAMSGADFVLSASAGARKNLESAKLKRLPSVQEDLKNNASSNTRFIAPMSAGATAAAAGSSSDDSDSIEVLVHHKSQMPMSASGHHHRRQPAEIKDLSSSQEVGAGSLSRPHTSSRKKEITLDSLKESLSLRPNTSSKGLERIMDHGGASYEPAPSTSHHRHSGHTHSASTSSKKEKTLETLKETLGRPTTSSKYSSLERGKGIVLESLSQSEARGLLRQASLERLGSSKISSFVRSASKSRAGYTLSSAGFKDGRIPTPEGRMVSARLQRLSSHDGRISPTSSRLPPVKTKKKSSKRCMVCGKKTGLATSYQCRCGSNFCATHRYAEAHACTFDYKTEGRKLLEQSNPVVSAPKLPKI